LTQKQKIPSFVVFNITMATKAPYQTTFEPEHTIRPIYTGGSVALDREGRILATTLGEDALLTDLNTGRQLAKIEGVCKLISGVILNIR
jgi:U3 small nucleolar RNA-associated protein 13